VKSDDGPILSYQSLIAQEKAIENGFNSCRGRREFH
jgi:hypothetical protein